MKIIISRNLDYINGHLRYGHKELEIEKENWNAMSKKEKEAFFDKNAKIIVDDYEIDDYEDSEEDFLVEENI